jgi:hypothetical protein
MPRLNSGRSGPASSMAARLTGPRCPSRRDAWCVGLDGCDVRNREDRQSSFEVIVGQSVPEDRDARYVGLVHGYDAKRKRRLFDLLKSQGLQTNQEVTFLTDGGEESPCVDRTCHPGVRTRAWLVHITMRLTVPSQYARGVAQHDDAKGTSPVGRAKADQVADLARQPRTAGLMGRPSTTLSPNVIPKPR